MAIAFTATTTHTKTLVAPDSGSEDKVYGSDYVSASSHTTTVGLTGLTANALLYASDTTTLAQSSNLTFDGTILTAPQFKGGDGTVALPAFRFTTAANLGFYYVSGALAFTSGGIAQYLDFGSQIRRISTSSIGWSSGDPSSTSMDLCQNRVAAGIMGIHTAAGAGSSGTIRCKYQSSDGTAGVSGTGSTITCKDGIITAIS